MSIQVLKPPMTAGQAFGQSLSEGFQEHFAGNVKRGSVAGGLKSLSDQATSLTPLEMYQKLWSIPGMDAQTASQIHPLLQKQQINKARSAAARIRGGTTPAGVGGESTLQEQPQDPLQEQPQEPLQRNYFGMELPEDEIQFESERLAEEQGIDPVIAREEIERRHGKRVPREVKNIEQYKSEVKGILNTEKDKGVRDKLGALVKAEGLKRLEAEGSKRPLDRNDVTKLVAEVHDFAKNRNNLSNLGRMYASSVFNRKSTIKKFNAIKNGYEKFGVKGREQFREDLISYNKLSAPTASRMAFPYSTGMESTLEKIKPSKLHHRKTPESIFENIYKNLTTSDSLLAIGLDLQEKGYDGSAFLNYLEGKTLTGDQNAEISRIPTGINQFKPTLGDIFLETNFFQPKRR